MSVIDLKIQAQYTYMNKKKKVSKPQQISDFLWKKLMFSRNLLAFAAKFWKKVSSSFRSVLRSVFIFSRSTRGFFFWRQIGYLFYYYVFQRLKCLTYCCKTSPFFSKVTISFITLCWLRIFLFRKSWGQNNYVKLSYSSELLNFISYEMLFFLLGVGEIHHRRSFQWF